MAQETSLRVGVDSRPAEQGARRVKGALKGVRSEARKTETQFDKLQKSLGGFGTLFAGIGVGLVVREFAQLLDSATNIDNRLKLVTNTTEEVNAVFSELVDISNATRTGLESNAALFNRLSLSTKEMGLTFKETLNFTRSLNQALIISGASAAEGGAGLIQLSQGLAAGALRGDELRSVLEGLPKVADVIAQGLGVTRGELRKLGEAGKISAEAVVDAFKKAAPELEEQFKKIAPTIESAFTVFSNKALEFVRSLNKSTGVGAFFANIILTLADNFNVVASAAAGFGIILGGVVLKAVIGFGIALAANPIGLLIIAVGALSTALGIFGDSTVEVSGMTVTGWQAIEAAVVTAWGFIEPIFNLWKEAFAVIGEAASVFSSGFKFDMAGVIGFLKGWASVVLGIMGAIPKTIIEVFKDIPTSLVTIFKSAVNGFLTFRNGVLDILGNMISKVGSLIGLFNEELGEKISSGIKGAFDAIKVDPIFDPLEGKFKDKAKALGEIWDDAFRTDRLDNFGEAFDKNLKKVVASDKAAVINTDLLNGSIGNLNRKMKENAEILKAREKFTKKIQSDFDSLREATGRATEVMKEWAAKQRAELKRLGLENTKFADQFEDILLNRMQAARLKDVENSQAWAAGLTESQRSVASSVRDEFETIRSARGENVAQLNEWAELERQKLKAVGLENSVFADQMEKIYAERLPEARRADLFAAKDAVSGVKQAMVEYAESVGTAADQTKNLFSNAFKNMEDGLVNFVKNGKLDFRSLIDSMIDDLIRLGIQQALTAAFGGGGGGGGFLGGLLGGGGGGGGGGIGGIVTSLFSGLFKEGGLSGSPVSGTMVPASAFKNAPRFGAGGVTGGMPAILHDNEAVIPLSRGREVPVKLENGGKSGDIINNWNITTPDADSFRRSQNQIQAKGSRSLARQNQRNN